MTAVWIICGVLVLIGIAGFIVDCDEAGFVLFTLAAIVFFFGLMVNVATRDDTEMYVDYTTIQNLGGNTAAIKYYIDDNNLLDEDESYNDLIANLNSWREEAKVRESIGEFREADKLDLTKLKPLDPIED